MAPVSIAEHVSVIDQLRDNFDATPDVDQLRQIHTLTEEIDTHCDSTENRIKSIIKGQLDKPHPPPRPRYPWLCSLAA